MYIKKKTEENVHKYFQQTSQENSYQPTYVIFVFFQRGRDIFVTKSKTQSNSTKKEFIESKTADLCVKIILIKEHPVKAYFVRLIDYLWMDK